MFSQPDLRSPAALKDIRSDACHAQKQFTFIIRRRNAKSDIKTYDRIIKAENISIRFGFDFGFETKTKKLRINKAL